MAKTKPKKPVAREIQINRETYTCPICREEHKLKTICPIVSKKLISAKLENQSFVMGGILLECIKQNKDFCRILSEIAYLIVGQDYGFNPIRYFDTDLVISYFSVVLKCSPRKFSISNSKLIDEYYDIIKNSYPESTISFRCNNGEISEIQLKWDIDIMPIDNGNYPAAMVSPPSFILSKELSERKPVYYLKLEIDPYYHGLCFDDDNLWGTTGGCKENIQFDIITLSESGFGSARDIYLCGEKEGKLKNLFESEFDWKELAKEEECDLRRVTEWLEKLRRPTERGFAKWTKQVWENKTNYSVIYGSSEIEISIITKIPESGIYGSIGYRYGDCIYIKESDKRMYHYGVIMTRMFPRNNKVQAPEILEISILRNFCNVIEATIKPDFYESLLNGQATKKIKRTDVLSITYSFVCSQKGHNIVPYCGIVPLITPENEKTEEKLYLGYCKDCDVFYIFRRDYYRLSQKGKFLCKIIDSNAKKVISDAVFQFNPQSILTEMGYNVQASSNLSAEERQEILKKAIGEGRISVNDTLNLLEMQIHLHSGKVNFENALRKWKEDAAFVKNYGINSGKEKTVSVIKT